MLVLHCVIGQAGSAVGEVSAGQTLGKGIPAAMTGPSSHVVLLLTGRAAGNPRTGPATLSHIGAGVANEAVSEVPYIAGVAEGLVAACRAVGDKGGAMGARRLSDIKHVAELTEVTK